MRGRGFTLFTILDEKPPDGFSCSGEQVQREERQKWAIEKPKLDNARKLRDLNVPTGAEFKETI